MKRDLGTSEVAKICGVCSRTVCHWIDTGLLPGWRIPNTRFRRVPIKNLIDFMDRHAMPGVDQLRSQQTSAA